MIKSLFCKHSDYVVVGSKLEKGSQIHQGSMKLYCECKSCGKLFTKIVPVSQFGLSYDKGRLRVYMPAKEGYRVETDNTDVGKTVKEVLFTGSVDYSTLINMMEDLICSLGSRVDSLSKTLYYYRNPIKFNNIAVVKELMEVLSDIRGMEYSHLMNLGEGEVISVSSAAGAAINKVFNRHMKFKYYDKVKFVERDGKFIYSRRTDRKK
jgi:hypothetical protein